MAYLIRYLIGKLCCRSPLSRRVNKREGRVVFDSFRDIECLLEIFFRLPRETDDYVGRDRYIWSGLSEFIYRLKI